MKRFAWLAAFLAVASVGHAAIIAGIARGTVPAPVFVSTPAINFAPDNVGPAMGVAFNNYLTVQGVATTTCSAGKPPAAFGLPCTGSSNTFVDNRDWTQGIWFSPTASIASHVGLVLEFVAAQGTSSNCSTVTSHCLGTKGYATANNMFFALRGNTTSDFWNSSCVTSPGTLSPAANAPILANHRYLLIYGLTGDGSGSSSTDGFPFVTLYDGSANAAIVSYSCATSDFGSGSYMGTGVSSGGAPLTTRNSWTDFGANSAIGTTFKQGTQDNIGPLFALTGAFPNTAGVPTATTIQNIAMGVTNIGPTGSPPAGMAIQAWYGLNSSAGNPLADTGPNSYPDLVSTGAYVAGPPVVAPTYVKIRERQPGFTWRIDPSTISSQAKAHSELLCNLTHVATGTVYDSGTVAADGTNNATSITYRLYNAANAQVATTTATISAGKWSVALAGIPWGGPYHRSAEWTNSAARIYMDRTPLYVGVLAGLDGQSETVHAQNLGSGGDVGADLPYNGEIASILTLPAIGHNNLTPTADEAGYHQLIRPLTAANSPGFIAAGFNQPMWNITYTGIAGGDLVIGREIYAETGCPTLFVHSGRDGHGRGVMAGDRVQESPTSSPAWMPNFGTSMVQNAGTPTVWNGDFYAQTTDDHQNGFILPGSLMLTIPYGSGTVVALDDGATGHITASDGSVGWTNYGFNSVQSDTATTATEVGFGSVANSGPTYWADISCEVNTTAGNGSFPCQGLPPGVIQGNVDLSANTAFATSGSICLGIPNISTAISQYCNNGMDQITITGGVTTPSALVAAINAASPVNNFIVASLSVGPGGTNKCGTGAVRCLTLTPIAVPNGTGNINTTLTPSGSCTGACITGITAAWTVSIETIAGSQEPRGTYDTNTTMQIPDGFGVTGDGTARSGYISQVMDEIRAPFSAYEQAIGGANVGTLLSAIQPIDVALFETTGVGYRNMPNWDVNTPVGIQIFHGTSPGTSPPNTIEFGNFWGGGTAVGSAATGQSSTLVIASSGAPFYNAGWCGQYQLSGYQTGHEAQNRGGGDKFFQCVAEGLLDGILGLPGGTNNWSLGPYITTATANYAAAGCTGGTPGTQYACIDVAIQLTSGDTAITLAGGATSSSGTGPTACPTGASNTPATDGDVSFICLGAVTARANTTAYTYGQIYSVASVAGIPSGGGYSGGYLYQITQAGTSAAAQTQTSSNFLFQSNVADGSAKWDLVGFNLPYSNSLYLSVGQTFVANGNAYEVVSASVATPIGQSCDGFMVGPLGAEIDQTGYTAATAPAAPYTGKATFSCTVTGASSVRLVRTDGGFWTAASNPKLLYSVGFPNITTAAWSGPVELTRDAQLLNGNRGFVGLGAGYETAPGMPMQPLSSEMAITP